MAVRSHHGAIVASSRARPTHTWPKLVSALLSGLCSVSGYLARRGGWVKEKFVTRWRATVPQGLEVVLRAGIHASARLGATNADAWHDFAQSIEDQFTGSRAPRGHRRSSSTMRERARLDPSRGVARCSWRTEASLVSPSASKRSPDHHATYGGALAVRVPRRAAARTTHRPERSTHRLRVTPEPPRRMTPIAREQHHRVVARPSLVLAPHHSHASDGARTPGARTPGVRTPASARPRPRPCAVPSASLC
jgi:hypothetical protein